MSALGLHIGELQRIVGQLETEVGEAEHYPTKDRQAIAAALTELNCRIELARVAILEHRTAEPRP